jgi:hypothetical protein
VEEPTKQSGSRTLQAVTQLAWALALLAVSLALCALPLLAAGPPQEWVGNFLLTLALTATGLVIATHRPRNPIGWLYCSAGLCQGLGLLTGAYGAYALVTRHGALPAGTWAIWVSTWLWALGILPVGTFGFLLFPDGRLPSPHWRPVAWAIGLAIGLFTASVAFLPGPMDTGLRLKLANPLGIEPARAVVEATYTVSGALVGIGLIVSVGSLVLRWRRAWGDERQQLKWVAYAAALLVVLESISSLLPHKVFSAAVPVVALLVPTMIGVAILKYRLYDIDRLINRTLVYGLLTVLLGVIYTGSVFGLGRLLSPATGESALAVAASTLAVAALFRPARRRIQAAVDRRFNRRKYNAATTIQAFSTHLREQVDLDTLSAELLTVVDQTMEPTRVSLWLRPAPSGSSGVGQPDRLPGVVGAWWAGVPAAVPR